MAPTFFPSEAALTYDEATTASPSVAPSSKISNDSDDYYKDDGEDYDDDYYYYHPSSGTHNPSGTFSPTSHGDYYYSSGMGTYPPSKGPKTAKADLVDPPPPTSVRAKARTRARQSFEW